MTFTVLVSALLTAFVVHAAPALVARQSISSSQISSFSPFTFYASTGYCRPSTIITWTCGANCDANPGFRPVASGGDGSDVQFWFVGFDPSLSTVIVSHQGTNPSQILPLITDADIITTTLDPTLFPGIDSSIEVHSGFATEQASTATTILGAVQDAMSAFGATNVTVVGHSLGAALALLDSVYLPLHLPAGTAFRTVSYGMPRVGNQEFANYVDAHLSVTHINNMKDSIPILPGMSLGFHHPSGEVHIDDSGEWALCPGQDNPSTQCTVGDVPTIFNGNEANHDGPYDGITMGC